MPHVFRYLRRLSSLLPLSLVVVLSACTVTPPPGGQAEITFKHLPQLRFDVADVVILQTYVPPLEAPNVEHTLSPSPGQLAERWARDRLVAGGRSGRLIYTVQEASAVATPLETKSGLTGLFTVDQAERFQVRIVVKLELVRDDGFTRAEVEAESDRSSTIPENATVTERERTWFTLNEAAVKDLDAELEKVIHQYMAGYLLN